jgi:hypothetical protein
MKRTKRPPLWLKEGAVVDFCATIGQPPTATGLVVKWGPELQASGRWVVWLEGKLGCVAVEACVKPAKTITHLIEESSVGQGLADIKTRGIDAHLADLSEDLSKLDES